jgi:glycerophosphoryl diester phosphodiesterase
MTGCISLESQAVPKKNPGFLVVGHRGAPLEAAENTIAAFDAAVALGARALELDLCVTADRQVVVWHDRDPDDTVAVARQNGAEGLLYVPFVPSGGSSYRRPVDQLTLDDLRMTHGYARRGTSARDPAATIPLLADVLDWAARTPELEALYLDIKVGRPEDAALILGEVAASGLAGVTLYALSIERAIVEAMIAEDVPGVRVVFDHEEGGALARSEELGLRDLSLGLTILRSESAVLDEVEEARLARAKKRIDSITVWTLSEPMQMTRFLFHGVDAIVTDDPARLDAIWQATL